MTSRYFSLNNDFVLEYKYSSDTYSTADKGFNLLVNGHDGRNYISSNDTFFPENVNILDKQYTTVDRTAGKFAYLNQDLVQNYNDYDTELTDVADLPIVFSSHYNITYDTLRIHFRSGYVFDDSEGIYINVKYKTKGAYEVNVANVIYLKTDSFKEFHVNSLLIGDILYNSYIDIKVPSLEFLKTEQKSFPSNTDKLFKKITNNQGILETGNVIIDFGTIKRKYTELRNITPAVTQEFTFFELESEHFFTVSPVDEYHEFYASIVEEDPTIGDYYILQAKTSKGSIADYITLLNQEINTDWILIHDILVYEQIDYTQVLSNKYHFVQEDSFDDPILYRPIIKNGNNAIAYTVQYGVRLVNKYNNDQILKTAQYVSTTPQKYGRKLARLNMGNVPTIDKIYNKIQVSELKYDYSIANKNKSIKEKYVINYFENNNICVVNSDVTAKSVALNDTSIKNQGECMIEIDDIDTYLKFNVYERNTGGLSNKNMNGIGDLYLTFIDNQGETLKIPQVYDNQFDNSKGEIAFKIPDSMCKQIVLFTNPKFYIITESQGQQSNIYDGVWVSAREYSSQIFTGLNKKQGETIIDLNKQIDDLNAMLKAKQEELDKKDQTIKDLNTTLANNAANTPVKNSPQRLNQDVQIASKFQLSSTLTLPQVKSLKTSNVGIFKNFIDNGEIIIETP